MAHHWVLAAGALRPELMAVAHHCTLMIVGPSHHHLLLDGISPMFGAFLLAVVGGISGEQEIWSAQHQVGVRLFSPTLEVV